MYIYLAQITNSITDTTSTKSFEPSSMDLAQNYLTLTALMPVMLLALVVMAFVGLLLLLVVISNLSDIANALDRPRLETLNVAGGTEVADTATREGRQGDQKSLAITAGIMVGVIVALASLFIEDSTGKAVALTSGATILLSSIFIPIFRAAAKSDRDENKTESKIDDAGARPGQGEPIKSDDDTQSN